MHGQVHNKLSDLTTLMKSIFAYYSSGLNKCRIDQFYEQEALNGKFILCIKSYMISTFHEIRRNN